MIFRRLLGYAPVQAAQALASFGAVYAFTRLLGAEDYGRYALVLTLMGVLHTMALSWAEAAAYWFHARAEAQGRLASHYRTQGVLMAIACIPGLALVGVAWAVAGAAPDYRPAIAWLFLLLPLSTLINTCLETHKAAGRVVRYAPVEMSRVLGGFAFGAALAWIGGLGAAAPFAGLAAASLIVAAVELPAFLKRGAGGVFDRREARAAFAFGWPVAGALLLDLALSAADRFIVAWYLGEAAVGAYAAGYGVADKTVFFLCVWAAMAGAPLALAAYESGDRAAFEAAAKRFAQILFLIGVPAAAGVALVAEPLAYVMVGEDLRDQAAAIMPWIAFAGLLNGVGFCYFAESFQLARRTGLRALVIAIPALSNIALNFAMIPAFGLIGAVWATLIAYAMAVILLGVIGGRLVRLPVPWADLAKVVASVALMAGAVSLVPDLPQGVALIAKAGLGALVYGAAAFALDAGGVRALLREALASRLAEPQRSEA